MALFRVLGLREPDREVLREVGGMSTVGPVRHCFLLRAVTTNTRSSWLACGHRACLDKWMEGLCPAITVI